MSISNQRTHILTAQRKKVAKSLARRSNQAVAKECLESLRIRKHIMLRIGFLLRQELKVMCFERVDSILQRSPSPEHDADDQNPIAWKILMTELSRHAPIMYNIMCSCTQTQRERNNRDAVIGMCCSILLKLRYARMSAIQKVIAVVLYAGHSSKQV